MIVPLVGQLAAVTSIAAACALLVLGPRSLVQHLFEVRPLGPHWL